MLYNERDGMSGRVGSERTDPAIANRASESGLGLIAKQAQLEGTQPGSPSIQRSPESLPVGSAPSGPDALDYRDDLRELLDKAHTERGLTRYRLCKQMGIDSGTLSNVLAKRRHFSLEKLEQILGLLGYRLSFTKLEQGS